MKIIITYYLNNIFKTNFLGRDNTSVLTSVIPNEYTQWRHISAMICAAFGSLVFIKL